MAPVGEDGWHLPTPGRGGPPCRRGQRQQMPPVGEDGWHLPTSGRRGPPSRRGLRQQMLPVGKDGWHSVGGGKANRIDPDKMKLTQHVADESSIRVSIHYNFKMGVIILSPCFTFFMQDI